MNAELKAIIEKQRNEIAAKRETAIALAVQASFEENVNPKHSAIDAQKSADMAAAQREYNARISAINAEAGEAKATATEEDKLAVSVAVGAEYDDALSQFDVMLKEED